jgi:hypothetical protein
MGVNQYDKTLTPRQILFLKNYLDPKSKTFSNAKQSALKAGFGKEYSEVIASIENEWLSESIKHEDLLKKAERNIDNFLSDPEDKRIQADITKFVAERIGKEKFSTKSEVEHTGNIDLMLKLDPEEEALLQKIVEKRKGK